MTTKRKKPAARKKTEKKAPKKKAATTVKIEDVPVPRDLTKPRDEETSGEYIRRMLKKRRWADEHLAAAVRKHYEGRTTTVKDMSWNRSKLRREEGIDLKRIRLDG